MHSSPRRAEPRDLRIRTRAKPSTTQASDHLPVQCFGVDDLAAVIAFTGTIETLVPPTYPKSQLRPTSAQELE